jgi:hypothetical protein
MGDGGSGGDDGGGTALGPLGINPLHFSASLFGLLFLFVLYLLLPRGVRVKYFGGYPKRYAWSARSRALGGGGGGGRGLGGGGGRKAGPSSSSGGGGNGGQRGGMRDASPYDNGGNNNNARGATNNYGVVQTPMLNPHGVGVDGNKSSGTVGSQQPSSNNASINVIGGGNEDVVVSAAMQQLRDPGVLIVAHGSRGKPKTVRLVLTETAITWRTEMRKRTVGGGGTYPNNAKELKLGKLHQVPLGHIMYVDIGKQTTALRRVENASVSETLCFSLLTKEGSLDLEANSPRERDALVQCFSLVLDEVHAQNWRDIYRGPSSDMPSSFDEGDGGGGNNVIGGGGGGHP